MKRKSLFQSSLFVAFMVLAALPLPARNALTIHQKDGSQFSFGFSEKPVITYTDSDLVLTTTGATVQYPLSSVAMLTFTDVGTEVEGIAADAVDTSVRMDEYTVSICGASPAKSVFLTDLSGKVLSTYETGRDGSATFSIAGLPSGTYIVRCESLTCKILKR